MQDADASPCRLAPAHCLSNCVTHLPTLVVFDVAVWSSQTAADTCITEWRRCNPSKADCCSGLFCQPTYPGCKAGAFVCKERPNSQCVKQGKPCAGQTGNSCCAGEHVVHRHEQHATGIASCCGQSTNLLHHCTCCPSAAVLRTDLPMELRESGGRLSACCQLRCPRQTLQQ